MAAQDNLARSYGDAFIDGTTLKATETPKLQRGTIDPIHSWLGYDDEPQYPPT